MWVAKDLIEKAEVRNGEEKGIKKSKLIAWDQKNKGAQTSKTVTSNLGIKIR